MVLSCSAFGCKQRFVKGGEYTFHMFPRDPDRRQLWANATRRANFTPTDNSSLCSRHFAESCFDTQRFGGVRWLKKDALPTIFTFPPHISEIKVPRRAARLQNGKPTILERLRRSKAKTLEEKPVLPEKKQKVTKYWDDFTENVSHGNRKVLLQWDDIPPDPVPEEKPAPQPNKQAVELKSVVASRATSVEEAEVKIESASPDDLTAPDAREPTSRGDDGGVTTSDTTAAPNAQEPTSSGGDGGATSRDTAPVPKRTRGIRYCGDFTEADFTCPVRVATAWRLATKHMDKQKRRINSLHQENSRLKRRIETLKSVLSHLDMYHL